VKPTVCRICEAKHWSWEPCDVKGVEVRDSIKEMRLGVSRHEPSVRVAAASVERAPASNGRKKKPAASSRRAKPEKAASEVRNDVESASDGRAEGPYQIGPDIRVLGARCRCGHEWIPKSVEVPAYCPKCKSRKWDEWTKETIAAAD